MHSHETPHVHMVHIEGPTTQTELVTEVLAKYQSTSSRFWVWVAIFGILFVLGLVGFFLRLAEGFEDRTKWAYTSATFVYLMSTFAAAPIVSFGMRFIKAHWRRPMTRIPEIFTLTSVLGLVLFLPILAALPPLEGRRNIWFDWPQFAPVGWDMLALIIQILIGISLLWMLVMPDLAIARDHLPASGRQRFARTFALGFRGEVVQWRVHRMGILTLGAMYLLMFPMLHSLILADLGAGLLPGWKDAIAPAFQVVSSLQAGIALTLVAMYIIRTMGGYERYLGVDQFWALSKPLLALSLLWFYFWWSTFIVWWYGRMPGDVGLLRFIMFETYKWPFLITFFLNFLFPFLALIWNPVRRSIIGPTIVSCSILIGAFFNIVRFYVAAFTVPDADLSHHVLEHLPAALVPAFPDILIIVGFISGAILLFMLGTRLVPLVSIWEVGEGIPLVEVRKFLGRYVRVIGKSH